MDKTIPVLSSLQSTSVGGRCPGLECFQLKIIDCSSGPTHYYRWMILCSTGIYRYWVTPVRAQLTWLKSLLNFVGGTEWVFETTSEHKTSDSCPETGKDFQDPVLLPQYQNLVINYGGRQNLRLKCC